MRSEINGIVRGYAKENGGDYEACWNKLYREYNKVAHTHVKGMAKRNHLNVIAYVEAVGMLEILLILAQNLYK